MAKKRKNSLFTMTSSLFIITGISAFGLAYMYQITKEPIKLQKTKKENEAIWKVFTDTEKSSDENTVYLFDTTGIVINKRVFAIESEPKSPIFYSQDIGSDSVTFFDLFKEEKYLGSAIKTLTNKGFSGKIELMIGISEAGKISGTAILSHKETPGLGDKMDASKSDFSKQFWGVAIEDILSDGKIKVKNDGGKVDAITASTISSRAFCDAVQNAYDLFIKNNIGGNE